MGSYEIASLRGHQPSEGALSSAHDVADSLVCAGFWSWQRWSADVCRRSTRTPSPSPSRTVDYAAMETAIEDKISSGSLGLSTINAVLVSVGGETKLAHYRNGSKPEDALHVWSVTKSVVSALIGIAIDEKIISGLDATLPELLPRYQKYLSAEEKSITLRQLMSMTAGFPPDDPAPFENIHSVFEQRTDPIPMILTDGLDSRRDMASAIRAVAHIWSPPCCGRRWFEPIRPSTHRS